MVDWSSGAAGRLAVVWLWRSGSCSEDDALVITESVNHDKTKIYTEQGGCDSIHPGANIRKSNFYRPRVNVLPLISPAHDAVTMDAAGCGAEWGSGMPESDQ